jgi:hypothetical protein
LAFADDHRYHRTTLFLLGELGDGVEDRVAHHGSM